MQIPPNWWASFFNGVVVDMWRQAIPAEQTAQEADAIVRHLGVAAGAHVLHVPCGAGRLALDLSARGYRVTGVDLSPEFLAHARAADPDGRVEWLERDMRDLPASAFDGAFCAGNSFGYLDDAGNGEFVRRVAGALRPGARFVLDTPMVVESLLRTIPDRSWYRVGDVHLLIENAYDAARGRLDIAYTLIADGEVTLRHGSHQAYTYRQLVALLDAAGFDVQVPEPWTRDSRHVVFIGTRR